MPTFSDIINRVESELVDGISFLPTLLSQDQINHDYLNWEFQLSGWFQTIPGGGFRQSVRMGKWKAVRYNIDSNIELYDLLSDTSEITNIAESNPDIIDRVSRIFNNDRSETIGFPYGGVNQDYRSMDRFRD